MQAEFIVHLLDKIKTSFEEITMVFKGRSLPKKVLGGVFLGLFWVVLPVKADINHSYKIVTPDAKYAASPEVIYKVVSPNASYAASPESLYRALAPSDMASKNRELELISRAQGFMNQVSQSGEDSPRVLAILDQWKKFEPELKLIAQKNAEVDELLLYLKSLKRVSETLTSSP